MALPKVTITFANGAIGAQTAINDGICGLVLPSTTAISDYTKPFSISSLKDADSYGLASNAFVQQFYAEAPAGSRLWIAQAAENTNAGFCAAAEALVAQSNGEAKTIALGYASLIESGLPSAISAAQTLAENLTTTLYAPTLILLPLGGTIDPDDLAAINTGSANRVGVVVGDTTADSDTAALGVVLGRIATTQAHVSIARVRDGTLAATELYIGSVLPENADVETIHNKGYITFRTFIGRAGYYISDDPLATVVSDDYHSILLRRTIDKAFRIAYEEMLDYVGESLDTNADGTIYAPVAKSIEGALRTAILTGMSESISGGNEGNGVEVEVDTTVNLLATSRLVVRLSIVPKGCAKSIEVELGFQVE